MNGIRRLLVLLLLLTAGYASARIIAKVPSQIRSTALPQAGSGRQSSPPVWNGVAERLDPSTLAAAAPILVSISASTQTSPSIAFSAINYAVAWNEGSRAWLRRFSLTGEPLDPMPIPLVDTVVRERGFAPRVVFDGRSYVAAAVADNATGFLALRIRITRIDATTGRTTGSFDGPITDPDGTFDLRSDGVQYCSGVDPVRYPLARCPRRRGEGREHGHTT